MVERLLYHAEIITLKGDGHRLKGKRRGVIAADETHSNAQLPAANRTQISTGVDNRLSCGLGGT